MHQKLFSPQLIVRKNEINSTNNFALELIKSENPAAGTVVLTLNQTKGRGQQTNSWESESGKNLTISVILRPEFLPIPQQFQISIVISLGVYDYLRQYVSGVAIKWPNDIYVGTKKIAGILIEHSIMGSVLSTSVCGIGLNINQSKFVSDAPNPISLSNCTGNVYDLEDELQNLLSCIERRYFQLENGFSHQLEKDYLDTMYWINEEHSFEDENGRFTGKIVGISEMGQLRIEAEGEERIYNFKEVSFI
ncbi:biotin--[acetyl-CoA-carboxylase] ligase [Marinifilum caeruleilacunae]|uniref:Biotin--[acetyl-CoA-carboxylase] ligase n=1 Tax=Marinifilum caeruleilacunae TaxID=2499076 RepID=A0ABX1WWH5_9BACT|nr:biotin--[acetyl-CoA-carboxylase] ligase [Marinifilum caeruleilacunae]NOU60461.1 biotin--[acetyl-CoA-carboxylase] ligase [Marinifilum caeruleilacunae]